MCLLYSAIAKNGGGGLTMNLWQCYVINITYYIVQYSENYLEFSVLSYIKHLI